MTEIILILYLLLIIVDVLLYETFRDLMFSFLLTKRNRKGALKIHNAQSAFDRFTFNYVKDHALQQKEFRFFHGFYIFNLYLMPIQYALLLIIPLVVLITELPLNIIIISVLVFLVIKFCFSIFLFFQHNSSRVFRFDKHYHKKQ